MEVKPEEALTATLYIKASSKQRSNLDARIGLGEKEHQAKIITGSDGSTFIDSEEYFEEQK